MDFTNIGSKVWNAYIWPLQHMFEFSNVHLKSWMWVKILTENLHIRIWEAWIWKVRKQHSPPKILLQTVHLAWPGYEANSAYPVLHLETCLWMELLHSTMWFKKQCRLSVMFQFALLPTYIFDSYCEHCFQWWRECCMWSVQSICSWYFPIYGIFLVTRRNRVHVSPVPT